MAFETCVVFARWVSFFVNAGGLGNVIGFRKVVGFGDVGGFGDVRRLET